MNELGMTDNSFTARQMSQMLLFWETGPESCMQKNNSSEADACNISISSR